jgi:uncharacterized protein YjbI with pentapeptide repeats
LLLYSRLTEIPLSRVNSLAFLVGSVVVALGCVFFVLPNILVHPRADLTTEQLLKARNDVRTAGIQILGGAVLLVGLLFTNRTLDLNRQGQELTRQGQITDRFTKATDQLGSDKIDTRLGGIYALERIARDSQADQGPVMEVLTAFVREHAPVPQTGAASATTTVSTDVQAVLTVVGRRKVSNDPTTHRLNLEATHLDEADLTGAFLGGANLTGAFLTGAFLEGANLTGANLGGANLTGAYLEGANLTDAFLTEANLTGAFLGRANLTGAFLLSANLTDAFLRGANLTHAYLEGANLLDATLTEANLTGANLTDANLTGANLTGVGGLTQAQIDSARADRTTTLPAGLKPRG